ncbi:DUF1501 domain-containing protein [bacterium]|nr:DUF1501 domain-containing protein [bacterium]
MNPNDIAPIIDTIPADACLRSGFGRSASRRGLLRAGSIALWGGPAMAGLDRFLAAREFSEAAPGTRPRGGSFGKAKRCILLFMWGGPAQQDTWDMKPEAPSEFRGEFRPISTSVPGLSICEHFPRLARQAHRLTVIRSMTHRDVNHTTATHEILTGRPIPRVGGGDVREDWPHYGAVLAKLDPARNRSVLPSYVQMRPELPDAAPRFVESSHGQGGGWMGPNFDPMTIDDDPSLGSYRPASANLPEGLSLERLQSRRELAEMLAGQSPGVAASGWQFQPMPTVMDRHRARAIDMLRDRKAIEAFDLSLEDPKLRERYGLNPHGQSVLQARRLVESGVPIVTVFWPNDGITNVSVYWDTHNRNFIDLKNRLMPPADQAFDALLDDLASRGMLDDTLIVWSGEFGRTPRVGQSVVGGAGAGRDGRDHWPHCFSTVLAGAGTRGGYVHGASDKYAAYPSRDAVTSGDLAATIYHLLGIDPDTELRDTLDRPMALTTGQVVPELLG